VNGDESEPGTFKDRLIIERTRHPADRRNDYFSAYALGCRQAFNFPSRRVFPRLPGVVGKALEEAKCEGIPGRNILGSGFDLEIILAPGSRAYICGEETALLESIEGKRRASEAQTPVPGGDRALPSGPTSSTTLRRWPTSRTSSITAPRWFAGHRFRSATPGHPPCSGVSGHVEKPGVYEFPMGITLRELIYDTVAASRTGRAEGDRSPAGPPFPSWTARPVDVRLDFDSVAKAGSMLDRPEVIVMD